MAVVIFPLNNERWNDLEALFGERGAYANCWGMFWRLERAQFKKLQNQS